MDSRRVMRGLGPHPSSSKRMDGRLPNPFCKTTPCTVGKSLKSLGPASGPDFVRHSVARPLARGRNDDDSEGAAQRAYCVLATRGGWAEVTKLVASSMAGPSGVGTFSQNGTRMRVPAMGANAISMLRWAARYLITGRSGM